MSGLDEIDELPIQDRKLSGQVKKSSGFHLGLPLGSI